MKPNLRALLLAGICAMTAGQSLAQEKTRVEWWYSNGGEIEVAIQKLISDFNASQDRFEVVGTRKGNYEETFAAMIAAYRVGQHPTIVQATERAFLTMLNSGAAVPVSALFKEKGYDLDWTSFLPPVRDFYVVNEAPAAMPFNSSTALMWYNADHFKAAGFDGPADTWEELDRQLRSIVEKGVSKCGMTLNSDYIWSMIEGYSSINDYPYGTKANGFDGMDTEYVFNKTPVVQQVERMKGWVDDGVIQFAGQGLSPSQLFTSGTCSTWFASTASHATVEANATSFQWSADYMPHEASVSEPKNSNIGGAALWVLKGRSDAETSGAAAFLNFVAQPKAQAEWSAATGYVPITSTAYELMKSEGFFEKHPTRELAIIQLSRAEPTENSRGFRFGNGNQVFTITKEELEKVWIGEKSVQAALDEAVAKANQVQRQYEALYAN